MKIQIVPEQFTQLLDRIGQTDWWGLGIQIFFQILAVGVAAYSGFYFQLKFRKIEKDEALRKQAHVYNESVLYLSTSLESIFAHMEQLVLPAFLKEREEHERLIELCKNPHDGHVRPIIEHAFSTIRPIDEVREEGFLGKIPDIGNYPNIAQAYYRLKTEIAQFRALSEDRAFLIKRRTGETEGLRKDRWILNRYGEVFDRTFKMMISGESILETAMFLLLEIMDVSKKTKESLKTNKINEIKVFVPVQNEYHEELRLRLRGIIDGYPEFRNRLLHISRKE